MKKKENTNEDKENIRVLNLQVEHLKKQLFSYKISELKQLNQEIKDLILDCTYLTMKYDIVMNLTESELYSSINGSSIEEFVGNSICVINRFRNVISTNLCSFTVTDVYDNKQYVEMMQECLENLMVLLHQKKLLKFNMDDWIDAGHPLGEAEIAIEEFSAALDYTRDIVISISESYWNRFQWCRALVESINKEEHFVTI